MPARRQRIRVRGTVQGVGFRPFVHRLAREERVGGLVRNEGRGVLLEVEGEAEQVHRFRERLEADLPAPGCIDQLEVTELEPAGCDGGLVIEPSRPSVRVVMTLAPDCNVCPDCRAELVDPADRRHRYPFTSCARCGPRYTIALALPYDRATTTMAPFRMCQACQSEYDDPLDRRHHAQHLACPDCGPRVWAVDPGGPLTPPPPEADPAGAIRRAAGALLDGQVVAVRGVGGFHLAVDAANPAAVARLRQRKRRQRKPLALMVRDLEWAHRVVELDPPALEALTSPAAPIVLAPAREDHPLAANLAPGTNDLGIMLPCSPLHHLLLTEGPPVLVMTSGNSPAEPITTDNGTALRELPADLFLLHDREIHVGCDDSVVRSTPHGVVPVRRARGFVPRSLEAGFLPSRRVLALGAELKVTLAALQGEQLVVGHHLGDMDNPRAEEALVAEVGRWCHLLQLDPEAVAVDLHPDLFTSQQAPLLLPGRPVIRVQHHHAHLAAIMVEHGLAPGTMVSGIILDGLGLGPDGTIWGGEVLTGDYVRVRRTGHLQPVAQPGGDRAAREPGRMATSLLVAAGLEGQGHPAFDSRVATLCHLPAVAPLTSSAGRLFDGVAALLGLAPTCQEHEGEAAMALEAAADASTTDAYPLPVEAGCLDTRALVTALVQDPAPVGVRAARFHNTLADGLVKLALGTGVELVALGGGSLVNRRLGARLVEGLERGGARVLLPRRLPPTDGGISAGQVAVGACQLDAGVYDAATGRGGS